MVQKDALILIGLSFVVLFLVNVSLTYVQWRDTRIRKPRATRRNRRTVTKVVQHVRPRNAREYKQQAARCNCSFCRSKDTAVSSQLSPGARGRQ